MGGKAPEVETGGPGGENPRKDLEAQGSIGWWI
jgi:hypothetical protein